MPTHDDLRSTTAARIISHVLTEIVDGTSVVPITTNGLPADAVMIPSAGLIVALTPLDPPCFCRSIEKAAAANACQVILLHTGLFPETLDPITVTLVTEEYGIELSESGMILCRMRDGRLLVAPQRGRSGYAVTPDGLVELDYAFSNAEERGDAACRFAAEIVRLLRTRR